MELSILLMEQIFAMVLIMMVGFAFVRVKLLKEKDTKILSKVILYAASPCIILNSFLMDYSSEKAQGFLFGIIGALAAHILFIALSVLGERLLGMNPVERASLMATNAGYILIPLVSATLGGEYVFYCSAFIAVQTFFFWTYLLVVFGHREAVSVRKVIFNPNILAIILGLVLFFGQLRLPMILTSAVTNMGNATGALSMLVIGMAIGNADLKKIFSNIRAYFVIVGRLIVCPVIVILLIWLSRICAVSPVAKNVLICTVLASAAPIGTMVTQFAELYDVMPQEAGAMNVLSVFGCIITMPFMVWLYQFLCR